MVLSCLQETRYFECGQVATEYGVQACRKQPCCDYKVSSITGGAFLTRSFSLGVVKK
jgi:hypothetical protein